MRKTLVYFIAAALVLVTGSYLRAAMTESGTANQSMFLCACGPGCVCGVKSESPEKCKCGIELAGMHLLKVKGKEGIFCQCGSECLCKIDPNDESKCGCGKQVKRMDITGMYICGCGPECECNSISMKPGKCQCGKALKKL